MDSLSACMVALVENHPHVTPHVMIPESAPDWAEVDLEPYTLSMGLDALAEECPSLGRRSECPGVAARRPAAGPTPKGDRAAGAAPKEAGGGARAAQGPDEIAARIRTLQVRIQ